MSVRRADVLSMQNAQTIGTWIAALALVILVVLQLRQAPPETAYQTIVASFSDESIVSALDALGMLGWHTESCRRASTGEGVHAKWNYECFLERVRREDPDKTTTILLRSSP